MFRAAYLSLLVFWATASVLQGAPSDGQVSEALRKPVLAANVAGVPPRLLLHQALTAQLAQAGMRIRTEQERITDGDSFSAWQKRVRSSCVEALGGFPERSPLLARVTGSVACSGYRIEKVLFESRPRFYVTALLFLPDAARFTPPYPGLLIPCGHSDAGKAFPGYQRGAVLAAVNGMAALVYDPIDQGERLQDNGKGNVAGHNVTGVSASLLGWNTATFRIWDGMRALDYLASRPDIDAKRLGCMGNSGGGTLTAYLSALDERIAVSAPSCYISSIQHVCAALGPQDAEQNIFGQMAFGLEHSGWLLMRAAKPTCVCTATKDFFPVEGACQTVSEVTSVYSRLRAAERLIRVEYDGKHGWAEPLRQDAVRWMSRWLRQGGDIVIPPETESGLKPEAANVTDSGQVLKLEGARSVYDLMRDEAIRLDAGHTVKDVRAFRDSVRRLAGIRPVDTLPVPVTYTLSSMVVEGCSIRHLSFLRTGAVPVAAVLFAPAETKGTPILVVDGFGKTNAAEAVSEYIRKGRTVLTADLSGFGETYGASHVFYGAANLDEGPAVMAYLLGKSLVGMRAEDALMCARWLAVACGMTDVDLHAANWAVTPALHAAVAEPGLFSYVSIADEPMPWEEVVSQGSRHRFSDIVHGALRAYKTADLMKVALRTQ